MDCKCVPYLLAVMINAVYASHGHRDLHTQHSSQHQLSSDVYSYHQMPTAMRGLFRSEYELMQNTGRKIAREQKSWINNMDSHNKIDDIIRQFMKDNTVEAVSDIDYHHGDLVKGCCHHVAFYSAVESLTNIGGVKKQLVHFMNTTPKKYQYVPFAICTGKEEYGDHGHCVQGTTIQNILVYESLSGNSLTPTFDQFEIPSYCQCVHY